MEKEIKALVFNKLGNFYFRFNNKIKGGNKIVYKNVGSVKYKEIWLEILEEVNKIDNGWKLFEGSSWYGDGSVYGMYKVFKK